jgi:hypothetical protein
LLSHCFFFQFRPAGVGFNSEFREWVSFT